MNWIWTRWWSEFHPAAPYRFRSPDNRRRTGTAAAGPVQDGLDAYKRQDFATALRLWQPEADQGNSAAQYHIGVLYRDGKGVVQDDARAVAWFRKAADQGDANAENNLAVSYRDGESVPQD